MVINGKIFLFLLVAFKVKFGKVDLKVLEFYEITNLSEVNHELEEVMEVKSVIDESENYALFIYENQLKVFNKKKQVLREIFLISVQLDSTTLFNLA